MSLNYTTYVSTLSSLTLIPSANPQFITILPNAIDYVEQRLYRELDCISENVTDASASTVANDRRFTLPTSKGTFQIVTNINVITGALTPESGTRNSCTPTSRDVLDWIWPSVVGAGVPNQWCYYSQANLAGFTQPDNIIFGPWPDQVYPVEVVGKIIPTPLSASNPTTFLSLYYPDLMIAASMVFFAGALKNYSAQSDDPKMAMSWEQQLQTLLASASKWEARKRFGGASWTAQAVEPNAVPQRG